MTEITIEDDHNLVNLIKIPFHVTELYLENCQNLRDIRALSKLFQLQSLLIKNCLNVTSFEVFYKVQFCNLSSLSIVGDEDNRLII